MELRQIKVYDFEELTEEIKEKVLNEFRNNNNFPFLEEDLKESFKEKLKENKIKVIDSDALYYSLSYCQGDGLSFVGSFKWGQYLVYIKQGYNSNLYSHKYTTDINIETLKGNDAKEEVYNKFKEVYYKICDELEKEGYNYIEDLNSDETIKEDIKLNKYKFRSNGEIEN